jgi:hypothetical protein
MSGYTDLRIMNLGTSLVSIQLHAPADLFREEGAPDSHCIESLVGTKTGVDDMARR